ncbi:MAG: hypothetical protein RI964_1191 [Pseudomonadota bacterium]
MFGKLLRGGETQPLPELSMVFRLPSERQLRIPSLGYDPVLAWSFLSHHIRRYPLDLRAHTQRVLLAQQEPLLDRLAGSLQDVFLALGDAGHLLRERLLTLVNDDLNDQDKAFFNHWQREGLRDGREQQWRKGSLLCSGQDIKPLRLVDIERSQVTARYANVMDEVFSCLEYGQVEMAQQLLEAEILAGTADEAMEQELLNIYQYTRNKDGLDAMIRQYEEVGRAIPTQWREKQQESVQWLK